MTGLRSEIATILRSLPGWLWLFAASWIALAVYWQWLVHSGGILGDMWAMLPGYQRLGEMDLPALWQELTNRFARVHVLAIPKIFFWINFYFFAGSGAFLKCCSFVLCLANYFLLLYLVGGEKLFLDNKKVLIISGIILFFNGFQILVIDWDFLLQHYLAVFFSLSAFLVYERYRYLPLVFFLAFLAGFSCGSGLATLGSLFFLLLARREKPYVLASCLAFISFAGYLIWPDSVVVSPGVEGLPDNDFFWAAPLLLLDYLSYPFSAFGNARWIGFLLLAAACHSFFRCFQSRNFSISDFLICYFFMIACTVAWGRYRFFTEDTDLSRFYVYIAPLWFLFLLRVAELNRFFFRAVAGLLCGLLAIGGLAAVAVASDHAGRMDMARIVALNGNFSHFAASRLDAMAVGESALKQQSGYLQQHQMDIYRPAFFMSGESEADSECHLEQRRSVVVSKGQFVDYLFSVRDLDIRTPVIFYAVDKNFAVRYQGVAVAAANRMKGWLVPLRDIGWKDWSLLLPVQWLSPGRVLLYTHLPRSESLHDFQWWGVTEDGSRCRIVFEQDVISVPE
jgi:hypothetical protein